MNKILKCLFFFAVMAVSFTGCREDIEMADPGEAINPQNDIVGTYTGTWSVALDGNVTEYPGSLTITAVSPYVGRIHISCPDRKIDAEVTINITKQNPDYRFYNEMPNNPLEAAFLGAVTPDGEATINFSKVEREGRKSYTFDYTFNGKR